MTNVRTIIPKSKRDVSVTRTPPFTHSMEEFFENFFENFPGRWMETREPFAWRWPLGKDFDRSFRLDVLDREENLLIRAELPGVTKDDVEITISGDYLTIEASREFKEEEEQENFYRHEVGYGTLSRTVALPVEVESEKVKAELVDGMLEITLPKVKVAKRHKVKVA